MKHRLSFVSVPFHKGRDTLYNITWCAFIGRQIVELFVRLEFIFETVRHYFLQVNPIAPLKLIGCFYVYCFCLLLPFSKFHCLYP
jgi:hypothetical protein